MKKLVVPGVVAAGVAAVGYLIYRGANAVLQDVCNDGYDDGYEDGYDDGYVEAAEGCAYDGNDPDLMEAYGWNDDDSGDESNEDEQNDDQDTKEADAQNADQEKH